MKFGEFSHSAAASFLNMRKSLGKIFVFDLLVIKWYSPGINATALQTYLTTF